MIALCFIGLELWMYNWDSSSYNSYIIFWRVTKLLHRLSTCFLLFDFLLWKRGRMAKTFRCSLAAGVRRAGSNPVLHSRSLWTWMSSKAQKSHCKFKLKLRLKLCRYFIIIIFHLMKLVFIQITQVWIHHFKSFNWVQSTQDEKASFIKGNQLKLTQVELFSFLFF